MKKFLICFLVLTMVFSGSTRVTQQDEIQTNQDTCNCSNLQENISELENTIEDLNESRNRYRELYLSENENITNREIRDIQNNITYIQKKAEMNYKEINNIEKKIWKFSIIIGSLLGLNLLSVGFSYAKEMSLLKRVRRNNEKSDQDSD